MQVKITIEVNGQIVKQHQATVEGTLEQMEEKVTALGRQVACDALQSSVDAIEAPRPLFRPRSDRPGTKGRKNGTSSV